MINLNYGITFVLRPSSNLFFYLVLLLNFLLYSSKVRALLPEYGNQNTFPSSSLIKASQFDVTQCTFNLDTKEFVELRGRTSVTTFDVHVFLRFMQHKNSVFIRTVMFLDVQQPSFQMGDQQSANTVTVPGSDEYRAKIKIAAKGAEDENLHPELMLSKILAKNGGKAAVQNQSSSWPISGFMRFPLEHRIHPYTTTGNASFISSNNNVGQTYRLAVKGGGPGKSCFFKPKVMPLNVQSGYHDQGTLLPWSQEVTPAVPSEAAVVLNPLWGVNSASLVLLERHIEHHHLLGFNKYILYAYPEHVEYLTQSPTLLHWAQNEVLQIVTLDALPRYLDMPHFYQRLVYNHAVLSHLGSNMYLAMIDLDEYLVPLKPGLNTIFDMLGACAPPRSHRVNLLFPRYHVIAVGWSNRTASELPLWLSNGSAGSQSNHPLLRYTLVDLQHPPHSKAIVIPGFISNFFVHSATAFTPYNTTHLDPSCMALAHLKNLHKSRVTGGLMVEQRFKPDPIWGAALKGLSKLYKYQVSVANSSNTNKKGGDESA